MEGEWIRLSGLGLRVAPVTCRALCLGICSRRLVLFVMLSGTCFALKPLSLGSAHGGWVQQSGNDTLVVWSGYWIGLPRVEKLRKDWLGQRQDMLPLSSGQVVWLQPHVSQPLCCILPEEERVLGVGGLSGPVCLSPLPALPPVGRTPLPDPAQNGLDESDVVLAHRASGGGEI